MLAQEATGFTFRFKNSINGGKESKHVLKVKSPIKCDLQNVVAIYNHGVSSMFLDGRLLGPVVDLREPVVHLFLGTGVVARFVSAVLLILTVALPGYSILSFVSRDGLRHAATITLTFCMGSLPYAASSLFIGEPWRFGLFILLGIALLIVYPICVVYAYPKGATNP